MSELTIERGRLIDTVEAWGPFFRITFDLFISSFGPSTWSSILSFKGNGGTNNCCNNGDRVPIVQLRDNGELYFINSVNGNGNAHFHTRVETNKWLEIEIEQTKMDGKVENYITLLSIDRKLRRKKRRHRRHFSIMIFFSRFSSLSKLTTKKSKEMKTMTQGLLKMSEYLPEIVSMIQPMRDLRT